ncbi:MAG: ABC transporter ATP-binding protein [Planctomycetes bacterium]|nr:ABC transporter ATP-binding protein [Planctomycetota bacterium]
MSIIQVSNLTKYYGRKIHALDSIDFTINDPISFGVLGPNGAGKTTLIKIIMGLCRPTDGSTFINGISSSSSSSRLSIGYLPESHNLPEYHTPRSFLDVTLTFFGFARSERRRRIDEILERVKMREWADVKIRKFSKGMRQRVGIASAVIAGPKIIFLDEPTDGVDPVGRKEIRDFIMELKRSGKTIFVNSHLLSEVEKTCDNVIILNKGKVVMQGNIEKMLVKGNIYEIAYDGSIETLKPDLQKLTVNIEFGQNKLEFTLQNGIKLNEVLKLFTSNEIPLRSVNEKRGSLEDLFIELVKDE